MKSTDNKTRKVYTLSIPPSPEDPYLHPVRHRRIINRFKRGNNSCHMLNSHGEVDFYLLLPSDENFEEIPEKNEEFGLNISKEHKLEIEIYYSQDFFGRFLFDLGNQLDSYCLSFIAVNKKVNIYFIRLIDETFACYGFKALNLPSVLCYDLDRQLTGQKPLSLPQFSDDLYSDEFFTSKILLSRAWGFYLDYTALLERLGTSEDAEEIISLHILHGMARLQKSRRRGISEDRIILWIGRRISIDNSQKPKEFYSIYMSGEALVGLKTKDAAAGIFEETLQELPEYWGKEWINPLGEEAVPLVIIHERNIYRLNLTARFYSMSRRLFAEHYSPHSGYQSYYDKIYLLQNEKADGKIYDLWLKRWEQGYDETGQLPVRDIEKLIEEGQEEDLTRIFMLLAKAPQQELDHLIMKICETFGKKAESYLLAGLQASPAHLRTAALLGLGILESDQAIPSLVRLARQDSNAQTVWDTFLMIGNPSVQALAELLRDPEPKIREKAMETLMLLGTPAAIGVIGSQNRKPLKGKDQG